MGIAKMIAILAASLFGSASASMPALPQEEVALMPPGKARSVSSGNCQNGWVDASFVDMGCLYFNSSTHVSWDDAVSSCHVATPNSSLVEITTEIQMDFIQMELGVLADHEGPRHWWTAATDVGINGKWFWAASLTLVEDYVWHAGYPSNTISKNCMMLHSSYKSGYNQVCDY